LANHLGTLHRVETDHPTELVTRLIKEFDGEIPSLSVKRPTLEEIYLKMIGEFDSLDQNLDGRGTSSLEGVQKP
jgi:hypothetical protein